MKFLLAAMVMFTVSCANHEIRLYETSFIDGCLLGAAVMAHSIKMQPNPIRVRAFCQNAHFEMIKRQNPQYKTKNVVDDHSGTRI